MPQRKSHHHHAKNDNNSRESAQPAASTSWDPVANWYKQWAGPDGSEYHQNLVIPAAIQLLASHPGQVILDIGCGTGVLAAHLPDSVTLIGVDASPKLIAYARAHHGGRATFHVGDARRLDQVSGVTKASCDGAVFLLSIQDMQPLAEVLRNASWAVRQGGHLVIIMKHPCFRIPRQSGWGWDEDRKLQFRRVDAYLSRMEVPTRPIGKGTPGAIKSFHRPLGDYMNGLRRVGFHVDRFIELPAYPAIVRRGSRSKAENRANREVPLYLGLRAVKHRK